MLATHRYRYRGRHRAPSTAGRATARVMTAATVAVLPAGLAQAAHAAPDSVWDRLAQCESSGRWDLNIGQFDGGLQFLPATWRGFGGAEFAPFAHQASRAEQIAVAERVLAVQGWDAWPACSRKVGVRGEGVTVRSGEPRSEARETPAPGTHKAGERRTTETSPRASSSPRAARGDTHVVRSGDTLSGIAAAHATTWPKLHAANRAVVADPDLIHPGEILQVA